MRKIKKAVAVAGILVALGTGAIVPDRPNRGGFERMHFNNPGLVVPLSLSIWGGGAVYDYDKDGNVDIVLEASKWVVPYHATKFYRNPGGSDWPVFEKGRIVSRDARYQPRAPGDRYQPNIDEIKKRHPNAPFYYPIYADLDGDGRRDVVYAASDTSKYGGFGGNNRHLGWGPDGVTWTNGCCETWVYYYRNVSGDSAADRVWGCPVALKPRGAAHGCFRAWGELTPIFGDVDGDDDDDMVMLGFTDEVIFFENVGVENHVPQFAEGRPVRRPDGRPMLLDAMCSNSHLFIDWNGDGRPDIFLSDETGSPTIMFNTGRKAADGAPVFEPQKHFLQQADELKLTAMAKADGVDYDGDGDWDFICGETTGRIAFLENLSGPGVERPKWAAPVYLTAGGKEIRFDGRPNVAVQGPMERNYGYSACSAADWDGDGFIDVMAIGTAGDVFLFRNPGKKGATDLEPGVPVEVEFKDGRQPLCFWEWRGDPGKKLRMPWRTNPQMHDWNKDGLMDLISLDWEGHYVLYRRYRDKSGKLKLAHPEVLVYEENGEPYVQNGNPFGNSGKQPFDVGDFDGDGLEDFIVNGGNVIFLRQIGKKDGKTLFRYTAPLTGEAIGNHEPKPTFVDFDGNGILDVVQSGQDGNFYYFRNPIADGGKLPHGDMVNISDSSTRWPRKYIISIPENPTPVEQYAAQELHDYAKKLTGEDLRLEKTKETKGARIVIRQRNNTELGMDGFRVKVMSDRSVVIAGGVRGVLYGVYDVLERFGGVKWYASWHEVVPKIDWFRLPVDTDYVRKPAFRMRQPYFTDILVHPDFAARMRATGTMKVPLESKHGGSGVQYSSKYGICHTYYNLVSPDEYFERHPEYFSEVRGVRIKDRTQLCLTNPDVFRICLSKLLKERDEHPEVNVMGVSHMDYNENWCTCTDCRKLIERFGGPSGAETDFCNRLAAEVAKKHPDVLLQMEAYQYTRKPPRGIKVHPNVIVNIAPIECDYAFPLTESKYKGSKSFVDDIQAWGAISKSMSVWDYVTSWYDYPMLMPIVYSFQGNYRFYRDCGVIDVFTQGPYQGYHGDFDQLKAYLCSKLMWDPDADEKAILDDFFDGYYGKAAPFVREYYEEACRRQRSVSASGERPLCTYGHFDGGDPEFFAWAAKLWEKARDAAKDEPDPIGFNVRMGEFGFDYTCLKLNARKFWVTRAPDRFEGGADPAELAARMLTAMSEASARKLPVRVAESGPMEVQFKPNLEALVKAGSPKCAADRCVIRPWQMEKNWRLKLTENVAGALDGTAFRIVNTVADWCPVFAAENVAYDEGVKYRVKVRLRLDRKPEMPDGTVFWAGANLRGERSLAARTLKASELSSDWQWHDIGTLAFEPGVFVYIGPASFDKAKSATNPACDAVWIDQLVLERVE